MKRAPSPTVSVVIPTWNRAHTLDAAIDSALAQDHAPLEILVCDDGSSDDTAARIARRRDRRVRLVAGPHSGLPAVPRNRGIRQSGGEWLAFLDSDDVWLPGKLRAQLALARALGCLAATGNAQRVVPGEGARGSLLAGRPARLCFHDLVRENQVVCSAAMFHCSLISKVGGFPEQPALRAIEDYALWLRVATYTDFAFVAAPLLAYTDDPTSSILRDDARDALFQREEVCRDYLAWAPRLSPRRALVHWMSARSWVRARAEPVRQPA